MTFLQYRCRPRRMAGTWGSCFRRRRRRWRWRRHTFRLLSITFEGMQLYHRVVQSPHTAMSSRKHWDVTEGT